MYWQARHDNRYKQSTDIYPSRVHGMSTFTVKAANAAGNSTKQLSITIAGSIPPESPTVTLAKFKERYNEIEADGFQSGKIYSGTAAIWASYAGK